MKIIVTEAEGRFIYSIMTSSNPDVWVGRPMATRTTDLTNAMSWQSELDANKVAKAIGGTVKARQLKGMLALAWWQLAIAPTPIPPRTRLTLVPATTVAPAEAKRPKAAKEAVPAPVVETQSKPIKKGPDRAVTVALLTASGLPLQVKSSDHYGDPKGPRLVLPKAPNVTRIFLYKMDEFTGLNGYQTPEQRKEKKLGAVTHVCDITDISQVGVLVSAVAEANGIKPVTKTKKTKVPKSSPAPLSEPEAVTVDESKADTSGTSQTNEGV